MASLEDDHRKRLEAVAARERQLDERDKTIDARSNVQARRDLHRNVKEELKARAKQFVLTTGTRRLRWGPLVATVFLMLAFLAAAGIFIAMDWNHPDLTNARAINLYTRQSLAILGFVLTTSFLIRWLQKWFQRHADEEFRLKRLDLDIDRASWLVEMALEWRLEKGEELPDRLIELLGRGLFTEADPGETDIHPIETAMTAFFANASNVSAEAPGFKVGFSRKAIDRVNKEAADDKK
jgi:hypothetical protein